MDLSSSLIDREYLAEISGGDTEFEKELVQAFLDAAPELIDSFNTAVAAHDPAKVTYTAHTLKGSSRSIGANSFAAVTEEAEKAARVGNLTLCQNLSPKISEEFTALVAFSACILEAA